MLIALLGLTYFGYGQAKKADQKFGIKWHGFVKADYMLDTHQTVTAREGHFLYFQHQTLPQVVTKQILTF